MTATAQSWANMTYDQQVFWIYFYTFAVLFLFIMPVFYLALYMLTDYEPALQFALLVAWFRERRWRELLPSRKPESSAAAPAAGPAAAIGRDAVAKPGTPSSCPRAGSGVPGAYFRSRHASRQAQDGVSAPGALPPLSDPPGRGRAHASKDRAR